MTSAPRNHKLGLLLVGMAVFCWGILPIGLKLATQFTDGLTLTWLRFGAALLVTFGLQAATGGLAGFEALTRGDWCKLVIAGLLLITNYNTFVWSLDHIAPSSAQLNFQVAPFFLIFGGVVLYGERVKLVQWLLLAVLAVGMVLFFHPHLQLSASTVQGNALTGISLVLLSALAWSIYALLQKSLLNKISSQNILLVIYVMGFVVMAPATELQGLQTISAGDWAVVAFCCLNTLVAYGAFAQSMKHLDTVQVSALVALSPVVSWAAAIVCVLMAWWPEVIIDPNLDALSIVGMLMVLGSAILVPLIGRKTPKIVQQTEPPQTLKKVA